ncbi:PrgH/EprH family type III secretion apparatus protein [Stenotrophomonas sp.]|uniref:PrgH/EprH family type III secretion apparatus protein n=1 Tax=Stenotrophomonas sp. TaxID=69392 RepID=UPI0028970194|nr:PrgH/EprH family type III secretion apparatus protein [Stenotrophomonas sp.]
MPLIHKLKLLSGQLDGVEFTLLPGDTVFHVGPARILHEGRMESTLANADNVFYIPGDHLPASFRIRCSETGVKLEVRENDNICWIAQDLPLNEVVYVAGLTLAVREEHEVWSLAVLDHRLPVLAKYESMERAAAAARPRTPLILWLVLGIMGAVLAATGWWLYDRQRPATQVRNLELVLAQSPYDYNVVHDKHGRIHAFSDTAEAMSWGQRASARAGRTKDIYHIRHLEIARIGTFLDSAGVDYAVIRLRTPQVPEVVITAVSADDSERRRRVAAMLAPHLPYATRIDVRSIGDGHLVSLARNGLNARGISTRTGSQAGRTSLTNDTFLDDAALHAMSRYRDEFVQEWGARRVHINIRLWDDLLKGRSYQYSDDQLLSIGEGRWEFSTSSSR